MFIASCRISAERVFSISAFQNVSRWWPATRDRSQGMHSIQINTSWSVRYWDRFLRLYLASCHFSKWSVLLPETLLFHRFIYIRMKSRKSTWKCGGRMWQSFNMNGSCRSHCNDVWWFYLMDCFVKYSLVQYKFKHNWYKMNFWCSHFEVQMTA